jgi:predicted transcriptional regulator
MNGISYDVIFLAGEDIKTGDDLELRHDAVTAYRSNDAKKRHIGTAKHDAKKGEEVALVRYATPRQARVHWRFFFGERDDS